LEKETDFLGFQLPEVRKEKKKEEVKIARFLYFYFCYIARFLAKSSYA
jgi:hypothetical protein